MQETVLVGGGPGGTALLIAATKQDKLRALARSGLVIVERDAALGGGRLGDYAIASDSTAETFLSAVKDNIHPEIAALFEQEPAREIARHTSVYGVPLTATGPFLRAIGKHLHGIVTQNGGQVKTGHEALCAQQERGGLWRTRIRRLSDGTESDLLSRNLVIATGGHQPLSRLAEERVAGMPLVGRVGDRLLQSGDIVGPGGYARVRDLLADKPAPRIAIIGGSTSALAAANVLLKGAPALPLGAGAVTVLHRRPLRPFYHSIEAAHAEGFTDFGPDDICPVSGFVYRLAGFRLEAREMVLRMLGIAGRVPDPRLTLQPLRDDADEAALETLDRADLVIAALGYRPHALPLLDAAGRAIPLAAHASGRPPLVDRQCRVIAADGAPVPDLYGIGLAAGFVPSGALGGEPSFSGQANGLWLWQNDVGLLIVDQLFAARQRAVA